MPYNGPPTNSIDYEPQLDVFYIQGTWHSEQTRHSLPSDPKGELCI